MTSTDSIRNYPPDLEKIWFELARTRLGSSSDADVLERLEPAVEALSTGFTTDREPGFDHYATDIERLLAYGFFFFPRTWVRTRLLMEECLGHGQWHLPQKVSRLWIVDTGAGTGAASLSAASCLADHFPNLAIQIDAEDTSFESLTLMSELTDRLLQTRPMPVTLSTHKSSGRNPRPPDTLIDLLIVSFALNEFMDERDVKTERAWLRDALRSLAPGGLLLIMEPALHPAAERIERLRDMVARDGRCRIVGPCLHYAPCPMLAKGKTWCHEVRAWTAPPTVADLNRRLHRSVEHLKWSFLALVNEPPGAVPSTPELCRLVGPVTEQSGRVSTWGCAADGQIHPYEVLTRHLSDADRTTFLDCERGDRVRWSDLTVLGDNTTCRSTQCPRLI